MKRLAGYSFILTFIWFGFVAAISFMEAPVKFTTPSLSMPVGLDVGRIVFSALNKAEITFAVLNIISVFIYTDEKRIKLIFASVVIILTIQTIWLLPALNERALIIINNGTLPESDIHLLYIVLESLKIILLFILGLWQIIYFKKLILNKTFI